jgi:hypothetical protein
MGRRFGFKPEGQARGTYAVVKLLVALVLIPGLRRFLTSVEDGWPPKKRP